jgi:hypothetical protein
MRLMERENAATVKVMRRIAEAAAVPRRGTAVLGEELYGDGCGVQGEGRGREIVCLPLGTRLLFGGNCAPALIPLVKPGKGR